MIGLLGCFFGFHRLRQWRGAGHCLRCKERLVLRNGQWHQFNEYEED